MKMEPSVPLRRYYRSLNEMFRMGEVYVEEGDIESGLTLFIRFTSMWLEAIPKHPNFATEDGAAEKAKAKVRIIIIIMIILIKSTQSKGPSPQSS